MKYMRKKAKMEQGICEIHEKKGKMEQGICEIDEKIGQMEEDKWNR